ncbi:response regulator transcription factor [Paenibacillus sp. J5C_2022]|uniref:response regulator transcription factor n=1 Tax=Paenibacillus sp. J5C2022 TaxID=2977129 RepID=UPI0021D392F3|nr:response regulator transcription factor [Paenibacillus sp. J5C2022]MCU6707995.1 response regulator transcription factor [Paenibacillus sp. J5C2022]
MSYTPTILIADDDPEIRDVIRIYLLNEGYRVLEAEDGAQVLRYMETDSIDLIILDVMMPVMNGLRTCLEVRHSYDTSIIMLSAKSEDMDKVAGLTTGADDYMTKPFHPLELIARVKANLRRQMRNLPAHQNQMTQEMSQIVVHDLVIDRDRHLVTVRGKEVQLTPIEFSILELMASHRGYVFSVDKIYRRVWKEDKFTSDNTVMVHIRNIREKIEANPREPRYVKTVWGVGYKIE